MFDRLFWVCSCDVPPMFIRMMYTTMPHELNEMLLTLPTQFPTHSARKASTTTSLHDSGGLRSVRRC